MQEAPTQESAAHEARPPTRFAPPPAADNATDQPRLPLSGVRALAANMWMRLLQLPVFYKVLIANSAIVLLGALAGTAITLRVASARSQDGLAVPLTAIFAIIGLFLTGALNALILRAALNPLERLQEVARRVRQGDVSARASLSPNVDAQIAQLADTLNQALDALQHYEEQMRALSGRVIRAQEEERQRIARELHDDTGQLLTLLLIRLKLLESQPGAEALADEIAELRGLVSGAIDRVRQLALNLRPPSLDQLGLIPALRSLAATYTASAGIPVKLDLPREHIRLSPERTIAVYRVAQEALTNIAKHAGASAVHLTIQLSATALTLTVRDDGHGFDPAALAYSPAHPSVSAPGASMPGVGLFGMEERARLAGGTLHIQSTPGHGAIVQLITPLDEPPHTSIPTAPLALPPQDAPPSAASDYAPARGTHPYE